MRSSAIMVFLCAGLVCCGDSRAQQQRAAAAQSFCEAWGALAKDVGCAELTACDVAADCDEPGAAFVTCVRRDLSQCYCEDGDEQLNCEGSFKPSEGPALCVDEYRAFDLCMDEHE